MLRLVLATIIAIAGGLLAKGMLPAFDVDVFFAGTLTGVATLGIITALRPGKED